jgi:hypothetical protein
MLPAQKDCPFEVFPVPLAVLTLLGHNKQLNRSPGTHTDAEEAGGRMWAANTRGNKLFFVLFLMYPNGNVTWAFSFISSRYLWNSRVIIVQGSLCWPYVHKRNTVTHCCSKWKCGNGWIVVAASGKCNIFFPIFDLLFMINIMCVVYSTVFSLIWLRSHDWMNRVGPSSIFFPLPTLLIPKISSCQGGIGVYFLELAEPGLLFYWPSLILWLFASLYHVSLH